MAEYYVATAAGGGDNAHPGTIGEPWLTLQWGVDHIAAGDTLYIRAGTYQAATFITVDGTDVAPIVITAYPGEAVIIDGNEMTIPAHNSYNPLIYNYGDYITISHLTIQNSGEYGILSEGANCILDYLNVSGCWKTGIHVGGDHNTGSNTIIDHCTAVSNSMCNENLILPSGWGVGISVSRYPSNCTIRNCVSHDNWGEGISTFEAFGTIIEDCISYDNLVGFYLSDTKSSTLQRCLSYYTPTCTKFDTYMHSTILEGDELGYPLTLEFGSQVII